MSYWVRMLLCFCFMTLLLGQELWIVFVLVRVKDLVRQELCMHLCAWFFIYFLQRLELLICLCIFVVMTMPLYFFFMRLPDWSERDNTFCVYRTWYSECLTKASDSSYAYHGQLPGRTMPLQDQCMHYNAGIPCSVSRTHWVGSILMAQDIKQFGVFVEF